MSTRIAMIKENLNQRKGKPEPNSVGISDGGAVLGVTPCSADFDSHDESTYDESPTLFQVLS
jgi:hypothetical protein